MILSWHTNTTFTQHEVNIIAFGFALMRNGTDWNQASWPVGLSRRNLSGIDTIFEIYDALESFGPLYAIYSGDISHCVVVTGVDIQSSTVYVNNPWGYAGEQSFDEFVDYFYGLGPSFSESTQLLNCYYWGYPR